MSQSDTSQTQAKQAGRGFLWITGAKVYFMLTGVALITLLPKLIATGDEERAKLYGTFTVVISVLNPITMMMITGTIQAVSKFISEDESRFGTVKRQALLLQTVFGGISAALFFLLAPLVAEHLLNDASLSPYLRVASIIIFAYAIYAALIGCFNGRKMFFHQAAMDTIFATLKVGLILLLAYLGFGVMGAVGGFATTSVIMLVVAALFVGSGPRSNEINWKDILRFEIWIILFALFSNLLMNFDLYLVKALGPDDTQVGIYSVALQMARLPYIAIISVTFVIFPLISASSYAEDLERTRSYIYTTTRYSLILVSLLAVTLSACALDVLRLIFSPIFHQGWPVLTLLPLAYLAYSFIMIFSTMISGSGRPWVSVIICAVTLALSAGFNALAIPLYGINGAAAATAAAMALGAVVAVAYLKHRFHARFPLATLLRLLVISALLFAAGWAWQPESKLLIIIKGIGMTGLFGASLLVFRELKRDDLSTFLSVLKKKQTS